MHGEYDQEVNKLNTFNYTSYSTELKVPSGVHDWVPNSRLGLFHREIPFHPLLIAAHALTRIQNVEGIHKCVQLFTYNSVLAFKCSLRKSRAAGRRRQATARLLMPSLCMTA